MSKLLRSSFLALSLLASSAVGAAAATWTNFVSDFSVSSIEYGIVSGTPTYDVLTDLSATAFGGLVQDYLDSHSVSSFVSYLAGSLYTANSGGTSSASDLATSLLDGVSHVAWVFSSDDNSFLLLFTGNTVEGWNGNVQAFSATAVPGPMAGAGLSGVLALMGFAMWRRRQMA